MKFDLDPDAGNSGRDHFDSKAISDSMLCKLIQAERDGEVFWRGVSNQIRRLTSESKQVHLSDDIAMDRGATFMTPIAKIQIGLLATAILISMFVSMLMLTMKSPPTPGIELNMPTVAANQKKRARSANVLNDAEIATDLAVDQSQRVSTPHVFPNALNTLISHSCKSVVQHAASKVDNGSNCVLDGQIKEPLKQNIISSQNRLENNLDASFPPVRHLNVSAVFNGSGYGRVCVNGEVTSSKMGPTEIATALPAIATEIHNRIAFIGPRIGPIQGVAIVKFDEDFERYEFENLKELEWAIDQMVARIDKIESKYRRRGQKADPVASCTTQTTRRINDLFQQWASDAMDSGGPVIRVSRDSKVKFSTIIDKAAFERFAETGEFELPQHDDVFLSITTLQKRGLAELKNDLANKREIGLFPNRQEFKEFSNSIQAWKNKSISNGLGLNQLGSREPLAEMLKDREDLKGLPLVMGEKCRMPDNNADAMNQVSRTIGPVLSRFNGFAARQVRGSGRHAQQHQLIANQLTQLSKNAGNDDLGIQHLRTADQMLQIEQPELRHELIKMLANSNSKASASMLSCYAKYDLDPGVRIAATRSLSSYRAEFYRDKLLAGLDYPWVEAAKHSAEAIVRLNDTGAIPYLVEKLKSPDPRVPQELDSGRYVKKEIVAINHMKNCLLCHADSNSNTDRGRAPVPAWDRPPPPQYYQASHNGLAARADVTYLRQDFSVVMKVENKPRHWPANQRMDFVVQESELTYGEYVQERERLKNTESNEYRNAILFVLRMLTDQDPHDNSYQNWMELTKEYRNSRS